MLYEITIKKGNAQLYAFQEKNFQGIKPSVIHAYWSMSKKFERRQRSKKVGCPSFNAQRPVNVMMFSRIFFALAGPASVEISCRLPQQQNLQDDRELRSVLM